jgi:hypothetical protein
VLDGKALARGESLDKVGVRAQPALVQAILTATTPG